MIASKKLTSKSGITIPKYIRAETGMVPGMAVDIETTRQGILIKPHVPTCRFCGCIEQVRSASGMDICLVCAGALKKELEHVYGI